MTEAGEVVILNMEKREKADSAAEAAAKTAAAEPPRGSVQWCCSRTKEFHNYWQICQKSLDEKHGLVRHDLHRAHSRRSQTTNIIYTDSATVNDALHTTHRHYTVPVKDLATCLQVKKMTVVSRKILGGSIWGVQMTKVE